MVPVEDMGLIKIDLSARSLGVLRETMNNAVKMFDMIDDRRRSSRKQS
ncbi:MAG: hypothetical protein IPJ75_16040 [Ignavibacteriales bacterium]|nr:hypothetical protein [Ignavibacteriales bacterium]